MAKPSPETIMDIILSRRQVYGLDADSLIRQAANRLTSRALFELLERLDSDSPDLATQLSDFLSTFPGEELTSLIGFDTGEIPAAEEDPEFAITGQPQEPVIYYLRLIFRNEDAAYYQFHLFPNLEADYVLGASRKRAGAAQHLRLELSRPAALQSFIEACRANPHFLRIEESSEEEFNRAPSNSI